MLSWSKMAIKIVSGEGPISDETLSDTEQRLGISLPPAYCEFQRQYGGGRPNSVQIYRNTAGVWC
jgi:SMI1-KNR4 cell-wall